MPFLRDRRQAGRRLAQKLGDYAGRSDVIVLGLPRGGMPVALEVARALAAPLDVFVVRKLGVPGHRELAMGAIASGGVRVLNDEVVRLLGIPPERLDAVVAEERRELERREVLYRGNRAPLDLQGRTVILVDDGLATGSTMRAAVAAARRLHPQRVVVAVPVGSRSACEVLAAEADQVICLSMPEPFGSVGQWYEIFGQTSDEEVRELLAEAATKAPGARPLAASSEGHLR
jgi:predicted phosphoribosyltransferase